MTIILNKSRSEQRRMHSSCPQRGRNHNSWAGPPPADVPKGCSMENEVGAVQRGETSTVLGSWGPARGRWGRGFSWLPGLRTSLWRMVARQGAACSWRFMHLSLGIGATGVRAAGPSGLHAAGVSQGSRSKLGNKLGRRSEKSASTAADPCPAFCPRGPMRSGGTVAASVGGGGDILLQV